MNITQGVPRLKEIVDGVVKISTPITTVELHVDVDKEELAATVTEKYLEKSAHDEEHHRMHVPWPDICIHYRVLQPISLPH